MSDSLFGPSVTTTTGSVDPVLQNLFGLKLNLANQTAQGGLPASMAGYIKNILVPSTVNTMTAQGMGRSGAVGEAVSNAVLGQGTQFLESMLSGIPSPFQFGVGTKTVQQKAGATDFLSLAGGLLNPEGILGQLLGTSTGASPLGMLGSGIGSLGSGIGGLLTNLFGNTPSSLSGFNISDLGLGSLGDLSGLTLGGGFAT